MSDALHGRPVALLLLGLAMVLLAIVIRPGAAEQATSVAAAHVRPDLPAPALACRDAVEKLLPHEVLSDREMAVRAERGSQRLEVDRRSRVRDHEGSEFRIDYTCSFARPGDSPERIQIKAHHL